MGKVIDFIKKIRGTPIFHKHPKFSPLFGVSDRTMLHALYWPGDETKNTAPEYIVCLYSDGRVVAINLSTNAKGEVNLEPHMVVTADGVPEPTFSQTQIDVLTLGHDMFGLTWPQAPGVVMKDKAYRQFVRDNIDYGSTMETVQ